MLTEKAEDIANFVDKSQERFVKRVQAGYINTVEQYICNMFSVILLQANLHKEIFTDEQQGNIQTMTNILLYNGR